MLFWQALSTNIINQPSSGDKFHAWLNGKLANLTL